MHLTARVFLLRMVDKVMHIALERAIAARIGKINGIFAPVSLGAPPGTPPPERSIASGSCCLRLQVDSLTWSGTTSQSGCGVYYWACLPLAEVFSLLLYICAV